MSHAPRIIKRAQHTGPNGLPPTFEGDFCSSIPRVMRAPDGTAWVEAADDDTPARGRILRNSDVVLTEAAFELPGSPGPRGFAPEQTRAPLPEPRVEGTLEEEIARVREQEEARWKALMHQEVEQARREAYRDGFAAGLGKAQADAAVEVSRLQASCQADVARLQTIWDDHIRASEPLLLELAVLVAEAVLDSPLSHTAQDASARALSRAVEDLAGDGTMTITLPPADFLRLQETGLADQLGAIHNGLRWNPDPDLPEGDWSVESPLAMVRRHREELIASIVSSLGLTVAPPTHDAPEPGLP